MKRILITGGSGFVGANLVRQCLTAGHELHLLLRPEFNPWRIQDVLPHVHCWETNLSNSESVSAVVGKIRPDWVLHLAVYGAYPAQNDFRRMVETNLVGTANLVDACLQVGVEIFVNTGSSSEYGYKDHAPAEDELLEPNSTYAVHKAAATHYCQYAAKKYGLPVTTLRLYSVYGPYEEPSRLIPTLIVHGMRGEYPHLADPATARDYIYSDDVVRACLTAAAHPEVVSGQIYNIGSGVQRTLAEVAQVAGELLSIPEPPVWGTLAARSWDTDTWVADPHKIKQHLGWEPVFSFRQGFEAMVGWLQDNPAMLSWYKAKISG